MNPLPFRPAPADTRPTRAEAEAAVTTLLRWCGDDPSREGLADTPARVARAFEEMTAGIGQDPTTTLGRVFTEVGGYDDLVLMRDIAFASHCEHHLMPFVGKAHVAYYPKGGVVGLSKLARVVSIIAKRLQTQERLTAEICDAMEAALAPRGVAVVVEAEHLCMSIRGIGSPGATTLTSRFTGLFADPAAQVRVMQMMRSIP